MRRVLLGLTIAGVLVSWTAPTLAAGEEATVTGELIEMLCYARMGRATGSAYTECAQKSALAGSPLGLLTEDQVITIIGDMTKNENAELLEFLGKKVEATGEITEGGGPGHRIIGKNTINMTAIRLL